MTVGITGHQTFENQSASSWVKTTLYRELHKIAANRAYSCLAKGSDQMFASIILELEIPLVAVIPCVNYEKTFSKPNLNKYQLLISQSKNKIQLDFEEPSPQAFYEAGKLVSDYSDILFAIWDNKPAKGLGGTADIVNYALQKKKKVIHINPINTTIKNYQLKK